ncbi:MAG: GH92 family glycosyl hydrolase [Cyclobacteriaceae bacterium]|nr:GH92 family glycosyl hydrolase [Cyclobacteriaceae bacterium]
MKNSNFLNRIILFFGSVSILLSCQKAEKQTSFLEYIDPNIGTVSQLLQPTRPTVHLPNQMVRMFPIRKDYLHDQISWYPMSISGHRREHLFGIKPVKNTPDASSHSKDLTYDHDHEIIKPWHYKAWLDEDDINVAFVPGAKTGMFTFENAGSVLFRIMQDGKFNIEGQQITGEEEFLGMKAWIYGEFNQQGLLQSGYAPGNDSEKYAWFQAPDGSGKIMFKYGFSFISAEQAKNNLQRELPGWDFDAQVNYAKNIWSEAINKIQVEGGTEAQKRTFYTSLYRTYERMINITEDGHYYSGYDGKVHQSDRPFYVDDWVWDTYLAHHPLRMILDPEQQADMLQSYALMYKQSGWMPTFPQVFGDYHAMNGHHYVITFLDAWRKGIQNFDAELAFEGSLKNAEEATMLPWRAGPKCELDDFYHDNGFYPALHPGETETVELVHPFEKRQAVAVTLGHSYDDWAIAEWAQDLGKSEIAAKYRPKAQNYRNLYHPEIRLFMPKDKRGNWINIDPKFDGGMGGRDYYDENNGWTYKWQVQHDIDGLIDLLGGKEKFAKDLDQLFREGLDRQRYAFWAKFPDATGLVGQFSMGNEPSFHIPYLYNYANEPWKTQKRIRFLIDTWFKDNIFGIPGDEDGGGMTAFVVFSMMGIYPVTPGLPEYSIGSPVFEKVTVDLNNGNTFSVIAHNCSAVNKYIQSAKLNGKALETAWINHQDIMNGGKLELEMGARPNKKWGQRK